MSISPVHLSMSSCISLSSARPSICTCECRSWSRSVGNAHSSTRWTCIRSVPHDALHVCCTRGHSTAGCSRPARQMCGYSGAPESRPRPTAGPPHNNWVTCWGRWVPPGWWACAAVPFPCDGTCAWCGLAPVCYSHNGPLGSCLHAQRMPWSSNMSSQHRSLKHRDSGSLSTLSWLQPTLKRKECVLIDVRGSEFTSDRCFPMMLRNLTVQTCCCGSSGYAGITSL